MNDEMDLRELFASASPKPTAEERSRILAAAAGVLDENRRSARHVGISLLVPRRALFAVVAVAALIVVLVSRPPESSQPRSAPFRTWAEHVAAADHALTLGSERFERAY